MTHKLCLKKDCFYNVWPGHVYCLKHGRYVVFDATEPVPGDEAPGEHPTSQKASPRSTL